MGAGRGAGGHRFARRGFGAAGVTRGGGSGWSWGARRVLGAGEESPWPSWLRLLGNGARTGIESSRRRLGEPRYRRAAPAGGRTGTRVSPEPSRGCAGSQHVGFIVYEAPERFGAKPGYLR